MVEYPFNMIWVKLENITLLTFPSHPFWKKLHAVGSNVIENEKYILFYAIFDILVCKKAHSLELKKLVGILFEDWNNK